MADRNRQDDDDKNHDEAEETITGNNKRNSETKKDKSGALPNIVLPSFRGLKKEAKRDAKPAGKREQGLEAAANGAGAVNVPITATSRPIVKGGLRKASTQTPSSQSDLSHDTNDAVATISPPIVKGGLRGRRPPQNTDPLPNGTSIPSTSRPIVKGGLRGRRPNEYQLPTQPRQDGSSTHDGLSTSTSGNVPGPADHQRTTTGSAIADLNRRDDEEAQFPSSEDESAELGNTAASESSMDATAPDRQEQPPEPARNSVISPSLDSSREATPGLVADEELVEAWQVLDDEDMDYQNAQAVDHEALEEKAVREKKARKRRRVGFALIFVAILVVVLSLVFGLQNTDNITAITRPPAVINTTLTPTSAPSEAPTAALDFYTTGLPDYSQASLKDPQSPQSLAINWLTDDYPNASSLEPWKIDQLFALATLYYSLDGTNWQNGLNRDWLDPTKDECEWWSRLFGSFNFGEYTPVNDDDSSPCTEDGRLFYLILDGAFNLSSPSVPLQVPPELALLTELRNFQLTESEVNEELTIFLPSELALVPKLQTLLLTDNKKLHGTIPPTIGSLSSLSFIDFDDNALNGTIPTELFLLTDLQSLRLSQNSLTGSLSTQFGLLTGLNALDLRGNSFSGDIPSELGLLEGLTILTISVNHSETSIPSEVANLPNLEVFLVDAVYGGMGDTFPAEVLNDTSVFRLDFSDQGLVGTLPTEIGLLTNLVLLNLDDNFLTGTLPTELGAMGLMALRFKNNLFTGPVPSELGAMSLLNFDLQNNLFTGQIPTELGQLEALYGLNMRGNFLSGTLPSELGRISSLLILRLNDNKLDGRVLSELGNLEALQLLELQNNFLTGFIPTQLAALKELSELHISGNSLEGRLPGGLCRLLDPGCFSAFDGCILDFDCGPNFCGCNCTCPENFPTFSPTTMAPTQTPL